MGVARAHAVAEIREKAYSVAAAQACEQTHVGAELRVVLELVRHGGGHRRQLELSLVLRQAQAAARGLGLGLGLELGLGLGLRLG